MEESMDGSGSGKVEGERVRRGAVSRTEREGLRIKRSLARAITGAIERAGMTVRSAQRATGIAAADFSRIRNDDLGRFSIDRLMTIAGRLGLAIELVIRRDAPERDEPRAASRGRRASGRRRAARR
ncbi:MAG: XRE family transcriptional regulator, partial [Steroidobacteraceae bacterium]